MSEFPSLDDLVKDKNTGPQGSGGLHVASNDTEEKLEKKMKQVKRKEKEVEALRFASQVGVPHIDLGTFPVTQYALKIMSREQSENLQAVCFYATQGEIRIGAVDPTMKDVESFVEELKHRTPAKIGLYVISEKSLERAHKLYDNLPVVEALTKDITIHAGDLEKVQADIDNFQSLKKLIERTSTTDTLTFLLGAALKLEASDMHIEAEDKGIVVRLRLDGILHDAVDLPKEMYKKLVSRIKLVSSLKINVKDKPQDGRFSILLPEGEVDVRVSTIPTVYGESIVMRLLKQSREGLSLDSLGLRGDAYEMLMHEITRPNGMIITTGPTGSGKTTSLYAIMQILNKPGVKIITLEDPVEYKMDGINQSQIDHSKGYTFAKGLRSMLRQDPDIAMVGEIRDIETADIAVQSALTGHLILSTVHTNSAAGAIPRFLSMGVKPFLLAPAVNSIIGQRLVRKLCEHCREEKVLDEKEQDRVNKLIEAMSEKDRAEIQGKEMTFYTPKGCDECGDIGYKGRIGIYEIFVMNADIEQLILSGNVSEFDIERVAIKHGMRTMVQDGIRKALEGITSVEEIFRVIE